MQYGNEKSRHTEIVGTDKFKSYYVVWKHNIYLPQHFRALLFKSYYVVWKPGKKIIDIENIKKV